MELILLERVPKLGYMGDVVRVKRGYARNYLLPQGKALRSSEANKKAFESRKLDLEARNLELRKDAESVAERLEGREFVIIRSASDTGSLYGSVTKRDIADAAAEEGISLHRRQIELERPIKELGVHRVTVALHPEVEVEVVANVARSLDEAALQAKGGSIADIVEQEAAEDEAEDEQAIAETIDGLDDPSQDSEEHPAEDDPEGMQTA